MGETIHDDARRFGIERPELEHYQYNEGEVTVTALTPESEKEWAVYLRKVGLARIAFYSLDK